MADELSQWMAAAEVQIQSGDHANALPYLHKVFVFAGEFSEVKARASLKLAVACRTTGQRFIGAEFLRETESVVSAVSALQQNLSSELAATARLFANDSDLENQYKDLMASVTRTWHRIGVPFSPVKENLRLVNVHRVDHPSPFFSNISWRCLLPFYEPGSSEPAFQPLLTAFDVNLGPHVKERFEKTLKFLQEEYDPELALIAAQELSTLAFTLRMRRVDVPAVEQAAADFAVNGVPIDILDDAPRTQKGDDFVKAAMDYAKQGADLFALPLLREAKKLYHAAGDYKGQRLAGFNEALALRRLGQDNNATAIGLSVYREAKQVEDAEIAEAIKAAFPAWFDRLEESESRLSDIDEWFAGGPYVLAERPFILDESSRKVLHACLSSEACAEFEASKLLNEAWNQEFPGIAAPFSKCRLPKTFDWSDPSFMSASPTAKLELGQLLRLMPIDGTLRLANAVTLEIPQGHTPETYAAEFTTRMFGALLVAHKRLDGAYSSGSGTSISAGNISTRGHVFDYETFRSPQMGDEGDLRLAQIQDLSNAINLIHVFLLKLRRLDLMADLIRKSAILYSQGKVVEPANMDLINRLAAHSSDLLQQRALALDFARALHASVSWRNLRANLPPLANPNSE